MNWLEQFLQWITYLNLYPEGLRWNILGVLWLAALTIMAARRFSWQFTKIGWKKPVHNPGSHLWVFAVFLFGFIGTFMFQILMDDFITVPINLVFGSWKLLAPGLGEWALWKLIAFKWDNYMLVIVFSAFFYVAGIWKFYHFTKVSLFWLSLTVAFQLILGSQHVFYFLSLSGYDRLIAFWISYPWFRIFTGFLFASVLKKPNQKIEMISTDNLSGIRYGESEASRSFR